MKPVRKSSNIIAMPTLGRKRRQQYVVDDVFFADHEFRIGTRLQNVGIVQKGSTWRVVGIYTMEPTDLKGVFNRTPVDNIHRLHDHVVLQREEHGRLLAEQKHMLYTGLKYSALWRLA